MMAARAVGSSQRMRLRLSVACAGEIPFAAGNVAVHSPDACGCARDAKVMAGHNRWTQIKRLKAREDSKRSKVFAKLAREIFITVREGGPVADMNPRLRMVLLKCRAANMPQDNVQRAIARGQGTQEDVSFHELTYEVFGPHGVALLVEIATDNRNRVAADVRAILIRHEGKMASAGAVSRLFQRKGQILVAREAAQEDRLMELALEAGAEDFKADPGGYEILSDPAYFEAVHLAITQADIACETATITSLPLQLVPIAGAELQGKITKLIELLEDHDDVKEVFSNAEFSG